MFVNISLAMFLKCFLRFRHFEPLFLKLVFLKKKRVYFTGFMFELVF